MKYLVRLAAILIVIVAAVVVDRLLTRGDRQILAAAVGDQLSVQDALLHYEHDTGALPVLLTTLAPEYLRADQLAGADGEALYIYDRGQRLLSRRRSLPVRGLYRRRALVEPIQLPPPVAVPATRPLIVREQLLLPGGPELSPAPAGALVFEAENYSETNYGWEVHPDETAAGGAYIHTKEGIGNGPGQKSGIYDFYNVEEGREYSRLRYHFHLPAAGEYYIYGRMWTTGSHCSNILNIGVDRGDPGPDGRYYCQNMANTTPFRWLWTQLGNAPVRFAAGDHYLHVFIHEDGIRLDQFIFSPAPIAGATPFAANFETVAGTAFADTAAPVDLMFDLESVVLTADCVPAMRLALRRLRPITGKLEVDVVLAGRWPLAHCEAAAADLPALAFLPLDAQQLPLAEMDRREYLLTAELRQDGVLRGSCRVPLMRPFAWQVCGTFPFLPNDVAGPLDGDHETPPDGFSWDDLSCRHLDAFGVLDFGLHTSGNSLHALANATIYARTQIEVPASADYLFKLQSDDQMLLWLDGRQIHRQDQQAPVTRSVARPQIHLTAGRHWLKMRVNQADLSSWRDGRWQASLRIRTLQDRLSDVIGVTPVAPAAQH